MLQRRQAENTLFESKALAFTGESNISYEDTHLSKYLSDDYDARFTDLSDPPSPQHGYFPNHPLKSSNNYDHSSDPPNNFLYVDPSNISDAAFANAYRKPTSKRSKSSK